MKKVGNSIPNWVHGVVIILSVAAMVAITILEGLGVMGTEGTPMILVPGITILTSGIGVQDKEKD